MRNRGAYFCGKLFFTDELLDAVPKGIILQTSIRRSSSLDPPIIDPTAECFTCNGDAMLFLESLAYIWKSVFVVVKTKHEVFVQV
jgi:hypothetical protein